MNKQCSTCGGRAAYYLVPPSGYCVTHNAWFTSSKRCASATMHDCIEYEAILRSITAAEDQDPDTTNRAATVQSHMDAIHPGHGATGLLSTEDIEKAHKRAFPDCDITNTVAPKETGGFLIRDISAHKHSGWICPTDGTFLPEFPKEAAFQREAMWYVMKPRWIIRRKISAAIRRKVRTVFTPVSFKA